jgi:hypothetical protein
VPASVPSPSASLASKPTAAQQSGERFASAPFLALTLLFPTAILVLNFVIGVLTPITAGPDDEMTMIDPVWRLVQGQHLGLDFYDPRGFGQFQLAALLWHLLGPHYYVMRLSADLMALVIVLCSAMVAVRQLRDRAGLAALFCTTVAFVASGPSLYGENQYFGLTVVYDRLMVAALLVLFLQSFANDWHIRSDRGLTDYFVSGILLNLLFLTKISGLAIGLATIVAGSLMRGPFRRSFVSIALTLLFFSVLLTIDFVLTETSLSGLIQEYRLAAQGRVGAISVGGFQGALWFARRLPVLGVVAAMTLYAVSRPIREPDKNDPLWRCLCIIAFYWVCQVVLNISNGSAADLVSLAPAAGVAIVTWTETGEAGAFWNRAWTRLRLRGLDQISARQALPLLICAIVIAPEALAAVRAVELDAAVASGTAKTVTISADRGIALKILTDSYAGEAVPYLDSGIRAINTLGAAHEKIANLDSNNPFPALFLAPDPKAIWVWWDFTPHTNVPVGYKPSWQEVIGDACIVTEPKKSPTRPMKYFAGPLIEAAAPHLASAFTVVYEDAIWKIWKRNGGCGTIGAQHL